MLLHNAFAFRLEYYCRYWWCGSAAVGRVLFDEVAGEACIRGSTWLWTLLWRVVRVLAAHCGRHMWAVHNHRVKMVQWEYACLHHVIVPR